MDGMVNDIVARAARVRLVLTDCDGVLTDGAVWVGESGEAMKRFSFRDGMGVERLRSVGIDVGMITGEVSEPVRRRAEKLKIVEFHEGISDKRSVLEEICTRWDLPPTAVAYIGDDVNDTEIMDAVGLAAAPSDAFPRARERAHVVVPERGGHGAFRALAELVVEARQGEMV
jgi:3-deoxy-D-manno-octulosonate 8-phosphate phosphatase (KDO 8-P phosphatase)